MLKFIGTIGVVFYCYVGGPFNFRIKILTMEHDFASLAYAPNPCYATVCRSTQLR